MKKLAKSHKFLIAVGCCILVLLAVLLFCWNFRYYSAEKVSEYYKEHSLYNPHHQAYDAPVQAVIARHRSSSFKKAEGMTIEEVHEKWGIPHAETGWGRYMEVYFTTNGYWVVLRYSYDVNADTNIVSAITIHKLK